VLTGRAVSGGGAYRPFVEALMPPMRSGQLIESPELRPFGELGFNTELVDLYMDEDGVTADLRSAKDGCRTIRAQYLVGATGPGAQFATCWASSTTPWVPRDITWGC
jgi:hypothetical protein